MPFDSTLPLQSDNIQPKIHRLPNEKPTIGEQLNLTLDTPYEVTIKERMCLHAITFLKVRFHDLHVRLYNAAFRNVCILTRRTKIIHLKSCVSCHRRSDGRAKQCWSDRMLMVPTVPTGPRVLSGGTPFTSLLMVTYSIKSTRYLNDQRHFY